MALACDTRVEHGHGKRSAQVLKRGLVLGRLRHAVVQQIMHGQKISSSGSGAASRYRSHLLRPLTPPPS